MFKEIARSLETGALAQVGLIAFVVAFTLILVYVFTLKKKTREEAKNLPLDDPQRLHLPTNGTQPTGAESNA